MCRPLVAWTDPDDRLLARDILGTDDIGAACVAIEDWVARHGLGQATVTEIELSSGAGVTLARADGGLLFVKVWPGRTGLDGLTAQLTVQRRLAERGFPAPALLVPPAPLGPSIAAAMAYARPGTTVGTATPAIRRAMTETLARLVAEANALSRVHDLPARTLPSGAIWPRPHNALFDFAATTAGAGWIDRLAGDALATLRDGASPMIAGHVDWSLRNLRFDGGVVAMVYDWDSVFREREAIVVGSAAAQFLIPADTPGTPAPAEAAAFVDEYAAARGVPFGAAERVEIAAATTYAWAYAARCEHALDPHGRPPAASARESLRALGPFRLDTA